MRAPPTGAWRGLLHRAPALAGNFAAMGDNSVVLSLWPGRPIPACARAPQRCRVVVLGATEAGVSAAFHLGESALLLEQREITGEADGVKVWEPPELNADSPPEPTPRCTWNDVLRTLESLTCAETRLGRRVTEIHTSAHRLQVSTGESFVYDKLVCTLRFPELRELIVDETPACIRNLEGWRNWLSGRDIELLDVATQIARGDIDCAAAGKRMAETIHHEMAVRYAPKTAVRSGTPTLFKPMLVRI
jgi:hypothetical protein